MELLVYHYFTRQLPPKHSMEPPMVFGMWMKDKHPFRSFLGIRPVHPVDSAGGNC